MCGCLLRILERRGRRRKKRKRRGGGEENRSHISQGWAYTWGDYEGSIFKREAHFLHSFPTSVLPPSSSFSLSLWS